MALSDDLERLEAAALRSAAMRGATALLDELVRLSASNGPAFATLLLEATLPSLAPTLAAAIRAAWAAGVADASTLVGEEVDVRRRPAVSRARELDASLAESLRRARALAAAGADLETIVSPLTAARQSINRYVRTEVVGAGNLGALEVADLSNLPSVWIAETNACVRCQAYAGLVSDPGERFPAGLTYGRRTPSIAASSAPKAPPLHPNCQCSLEPLGSQEYADALVRESERSILRGFSLASEPMSVRIDAARRLLERRPPVDAPASVIAYARRAVEAGTFPTRGRP